jgi:hypothetical protein
VPLYATTPFVDFVNQKPFVPQLIFLFGIQFTRLQGSAVSFIVSGALEIGNTTGLQIQHLQGLLNKYAALIMLLYFVHVLLLCLCFGNISIKRCCFPTCCFVTMSIHWQMPQRALLYPQSSCQDWSQVYCMRSTF